MCGGKETILFVLGRIITKQQSITYKELRIRNLALTDSFFSQIQINECRKDYCDIELDLCSNWGKQLDFKMTHYRIIANSLWFNSGINNSNIQ